MVWQDLNNLPLVNKKKVKTNTFHKNLMEQSSENLAHCGIVLCFNDSVYLKKMRQDITSSSTYIDIFFH